MTGETRLRSEDRALVLGLGITGQSVARALRRRDIVVTVIDDRPTDATREFARDLGVDLIESPDQETLEAALTGAAAFIPSPGVPESHAAFGIAAAHQIPTISEFDMARWWDDRPIAAVTGTDGKTSVTLLTVAMLEASGVAAVAVGNTETPLIDVIDDPAFDAFVVEASSFRLAHSERFEPVAAAWLNFSPDHLDVHSSLESYENAKAKIWAFLPPDGLAVAPADDVVVRSHLPTDRPHTIVGLEPVAGVDGFVEAGRLILDGVDIAGLEDLERTFPHDVSNTLVAAALAVKLGATVTGIRAALATHVLPPHRIQHVLTSEGVSFYNDSKATVPHAVVTAVRAFESVVLIAGGKNKGLDLGGLRDIADRTRAVVAMGDAAEEIVAIFEGQTNVIRATSMDEAVRVALSAAEIGDAVLLSPGCTSFDAYPNYGARGDDFIRAVHELVEVS
ncbi:MAG: UDP-N-acetylmuramoyl-L-alanine--D-glutamate ligase [Acidimicrobiia bacterium]|nr:UDP-N-acetylmuramoyl-L-alanine--D-glutamate ligase [Acidimicrobiia bacterium]